MCGRLAGWLQVLGRYRRRMHAGCFQGSVSLGGGWGLEVLQESTGDAIHDQNREAG